jgi:urate oxidase
MDGDSAQDVSYEISYGKLRVPLYRVYASPLSGVPPIPESAFTGRPNILIGLEIDLEVFGESFLPAYTEGDNSRVVATDSMKNVILQQTLTYGGATMEGLLAHLGSYFLATYDDMERLRLTARELPFAPVQVPMQDQTGFTDSAVLFERHPGSYSTATLSMERGEHGGMVITDHCCGRTGLELLKVTGSSFTRFVRDANTTLPERGDRPLFIDLDISWRYIDTVDMLASDHSHYVPTEQIRDLTQTVFHEFVSESIQHLAHEIGMRILKRFPQLSEVSFEAHNRTPDPVATSDTDPRMKVYSAPFPAYGLIRLTVRRGARSDDTQPEQPGPEEAL